LDSDSGKNQLFLNCINLLILDLSKIFSSCQVGKEMQFQPPFETFLILNWLIEHFQDISIVNFSETDKRIHTNLK